MKPEEAIKKEMRKKKVYTFKQLCEMLYFAEFIGEIRAKFGQTISVKALAESKEFKEYSKHNKVNLDKMLELMMRTGMMFRPKKGMIEFI